jgi:hypothetical protein
MEILENPVNIDKEKENEQQASIQSYEFRKVHAIMGEHSFSFVIPKKYAIEIGVGKGDFVKVILERDHLVVKKA